MYPYFVSEDYCLVRERSSASRCTAAQFHEALLELSTGSTRPDLAHSCELQPKRFPNLLLLLQTTPVRPNPNPTIFLEIFSRNLSTTMTMSTILSLSTPTSPTSSDSSRPSTLSSFCCLTSASTWQIQSFSNDSRQRCSLCSTQSNLSSRKTLTSEISLRISTVLSRL